VALQDAWFTDTYVKLLRQQIEIDLGDTTPGLFKGALFLGTVGSGSPDFDQADPAYGSSPWDDGETSGPGYTAGGEELTVVSFGQLGSTPNKVGWDFADVQWTSATFEAEGILIYAPSLTDRAFIFRHFGQPYDVSDGTFTISWHVDGLWRNVLRAA